MKTILYFDCNASRIAYAYHLCMKVGGVAEGGTITFDSDDELQNKEEHGMAMDKICDDGCYGYSNQYEDNVISITINDLSYHKHGWKALMMHLSTINCLIVRIAQSDDEENSILNVWDELIREIIK